MRQKLHKQLPATTEAIQHDGIPEPQRILLNIPTKSILGTPNNEPVHHQRYRTRTQAIQKITRCIEFFNWQRKQARLGQTLLPTAFTQRYYEDQLAA
jgi:hypothetical protein